MIGMSRSTGQSIVNDSHLLQSLRDILTTPIGSRVMRRDYGSLLPFLIDQPLNAFTLMQFRAAVIHAILRWENRVTPKSVRFDIGTIGITTLTIEYQDQRGNNNTETITLGAAA